MPQVLAFLQSIGLAPYAKTLLQEGFDTLEKLQEVTADDAREMHFRLADRKVLLRALAQLPASGALPTMSDAAVSPQPSTTSAGPPLQAQPQDPYAPRGPLVSPRVEPGVSVHAGPHEPAPLQLRQPTHDAEGPRQVHELAEEGSDVTQRDTEQPPASQQQQQQQQQP